MQIPGATRGSGGGYGNRLLAQISIRLTYHSWFLERSQIESARRGSRNADQRRSA